MHCLLTREKTVKIGLAQTKDIAKINVAWCFLFWGGGRHRVYLYSQF